MPKSITKITVVRELDSDPNLSYLGVYSNSPDKIHIDRKARGDQLARQYRYFNLGTGDPDYIKTDYARMEAYNRQDWHMVGVHASAEVVVEGVCQRVTSGGLWGIESDSGESHFREIEAEQLAELRAVLKELGFNPRQIGKAIKNAESEPV